MWVKIVTLFGLLGIPSIFAMTSWCIKKILQFSEELKIIMQSQQADMRTKLLNDFNKYYKQGSVSQEDLDEWENRYQAYHKLGSNGVMDSRRQALLQLPVIPNN